MTETTQGTKCAETFAEGVALWERFENLAPEEVEELLDSLEAEDASSGASGFGLVVGGPLGHDTGEVSGFLDAELYCAALWEEAA
ncbi:hypothetical protein GBA65_22140 (plasmid) [Rubrobacter marinus]|uniref:Uncharacterized protein n=1 Tax=Rubrobacter marinus TaxID=2653852 RepID=A0A6G8Q3V1_9ACTN|nr:hypothetical protein [Rubrobacter marinus]QIN81136.1 hypothetical protein GBA65_22140 [Rubrobacter marinus]